MPKYEYACIIEAYKTNYVELSQLPVPDWTKQKWWTEVWVFLPGAKGVLDGDNWLDALNRLGDDGWDLAATQTPNAKVIDKLYELGWVNASHPLKVKYILRRKKS